MEKPDKYFIQPANEAQRLEWEQRDAAIKDVAMKIPAETFEQIWAREREEGERKLREALAHSERTAKRDMISAVDQAINSRLLNGTGRLDRWLDRAMAVLSALAVACGVAFLTGLLGFLVWASANIWRHVLGG